MLVKAAAKVGLSAEEIVDFSEDQYKVRSFLDHLVVGWRAPHTIAQSPIWHEELIGSEEGTVLNQQQHVALVESAIRTAYKHDNVVIVGRGGQAILKDNPNVLHVRVRAPLDFRIRYLHHQANLNSTEAEAKIAERDYAANSYLKDFYDIDWDDSLLYHLTINSGTLGIETAVQLIAKAVAALSTEKDR
jgi:cytidylate kinase